jgi:hypothetical protein
MTEWATGLETQASLLRDCVGVVTSLLSNEVTKRKTLIDWIERAP